MQTEPTLNSKAPIETPVWRSLRLFIGAVAQFLQANIAQRDRTASIGNWLSISFAVFVGIICAVAPWWLPIGLIIAAMFMVITARSPFIGLVITFMLAFEAIPSRIAPDIPIGFFKLKPYELIFLWTLFVHIIRVLVDKKNEKAEVPEFTIPVAFILFWVIIGVVYGKYFQVNGEMVLAEARGFLGLLAIPLIQLIVKDSRDITRLSLWISIISVILSIYIVIQAATGIAILGGRVEALDSRSNSDVTRSVVDAGVYVLGFGLYHMSLSLRHNKQWRIWVLPFVVIVLLGLLATFTRGAWAAAALGALVAAFLTNRWRGVFITIILGTVMIGITVTAAFVIKPRVAEAAIERVLGIGKELREGGSYGWRKLENEQAIKVIEEHPILGVGLGGIYKKTASSIGSFDAEYFFIHNSYLFFPLKMGLLAGLGPLLIAFAYILLMLRALRATSGHVGPTLSACSGTVAMIFIGAIEGPHLKTFPGLLILGAVLSLASISHKLTASESYSKARTSINNKLSFK